MLPKIYCFRVNPKKFITTVVINNDKGITKATIKDSFKPMNTNKTAITTNKPPNALIKTVFKTI